VQDGKLAEEKCSERITQGLSFRAVP
jgi:hypothetical protein